MEVGAFIQWAWGKVGWALPVTLMGLCTWFTLHSGYPILPGLSALIFVVQATTDL